MASTLMDKGSIDEAARILDISEFDFMEAAYTLWFGKAPPEGEVDKAYSDYFEHDIIPFWTRDAARKVVEKCRYKDCDPEEFGIVRPEVDPETRARGQWYIIMLTIGITAFFYMVVNTPISY